MKRKTILQIACLMLIIIGVSQGASAQHYVADNAWFFRNFGTPELSWETYRDTFIGIPPTRNHASAGFDLLFYDYVYKTELSPPGNCYGMALMSLLILKKGGHLGYLCSLRSVSRR
jgi:hypothetical protein